MRKEIALCGGMMTCLSLGCQSDPVDPRSLWDEYDRLFVSYATEINAATGKEVVKVLPVEPGTIPRQIKIQGTYYELGYWMGLMAKKNNRRPSPRLEAAAEINHEIEAMYRRVFPKYLDLVRGLCSALDVSADEVDLRHLEREFLNNMWWDLFQYPRFSEHAFSGSADPWKSCSALWARVEPQQLSLLAHNFDHDYDRPHFIVDSNLSGAYRVLGSTIYSIYDGVVEGMTEKGLGLAEATNGYPPEYNQAQPNYPSVPAVQFGRMMRIALETCSTVEQVIALYESTRVWFPTNVTHVLVADAGGHAAVLEFDPEGRLRVFTSNVPYLVMTNVAYHEGPDSMRRLCQRYAVATNIFAAGVQDRQGFTVVADAIRVTSGQYRTLWTSYFDLQALSMEVRLRTDAFAVPHTYSFH